MASPSRSTGTAESDLSDDAISVSSGSEYTVDRILAQWQDEATGKDYYLVRWLHYPDEHCTWEPKESFLHPATLEQWEDDKKANRIPPKNVVGEILEKMEIYAEEMKARSKRGQKRRREASNDYDSTVKDRKSADITSHSSAVGPGSNRAPQPHAAPLSPFTARTNSTSVSTTTAITDRPSRRNSHVPTAPVTQSVSSSQRSSQPEAPRRGNSKSETANDSQSRRLSAPAPRPSKSVFHEIGIERKARQSTVAMPATRGAPGTHFKTLRTLHRNQLLRKNEPPPDLSKIKLKSASAFDHGDDIALNLPAAAPRQKSHQPSDQHVSSLRDYDHRQHDSTFTLVSHSKPAAGAFGNSQGPQVPLEIHQRATIPQPNDGNSSQVRWAHNGRYWFYGELAVHVSLVSDRMRDQEVGDVRLGGLPSWFCPKMISLKSSGRIYLRFDRNNLVSREMYENLCRGGSNEIKAHPWMLGYSDPYDNTQNAVRELAEWLNHHELAALWFHPTDAFVLIAFAPESPKWSFLGTPDQYPTGEIIHLVLRNRMPMPPQPPASVLAAQIAPNSPSVERFDESSHANSDDHRHYQAPEHEQARTTGFQGPPAFPSQTSKPISDRSEYSRSILGLNKTEANSSVVKTLEPPRYPGRSHNAWTVSEISSALSQADNQSPVVDTMRSSPDPESSVTSSLTLDLPEDSKIDAFFEEKFGITYERLVVPGAISGKEIIDLEKVRFYLAFPSSHAAELDGFRALISNHTLPGLIYTTQDKDGWDTFSTILGRHIGVILIHAGWPHYVSLPRLATMLEQKPNLSVFHVSLKETLPLSDTPRHIERLFVRGFAMLVTEACIVELPDETAAIIRWFTKIAASKRGSWRLFCRPNIKRWLRDYALSTKHRRSVLEILAKITEIASDLTNTHNQISSDDESDAESFGGWGDDLGKPGLLVSTARLVSLDKRKETASPGDDETEDALLAYFAGWACQNAQRHRRFLALSPASKKEWSRWGHIDIQHPEKFIQQMKIPTG